MSEPTIDQLKEEHSRQLAGDNFKLKEENARLTAELEASQEGRHPDDAVLQNQHLKSSLAQAEAYCAEMREALEYCPQHSPSCECESCNRVAKALSSTCGTALLEELEDYRKREHDRKHHTLTCPRCTETFHEKDMQSNPDEFWSCPLCHCHQHSKCRSPLEPDHEATALLEELRELREFCKSVIWLHDSKPAFLSQEGEAVLCKQLTELIDRSRDRLRTFKEKHV